MKRLIILISIALLSLVSCKQEINYSISTKVQPEEGGSIIMTPSSGSVLEGTSVSFTANPNGDYVFTGWSGGISGTENPKTVTVTSDMSVVANFTLKTYPLTLSIEGEGTVAERVISTKTEYDSGTVVELTAKPSDHWLFDHWEGDLNGNTNPVQITASSPKSVKAVFVKKMYDLTVSVDGEGAVSETIVGTRSGSYQEGTVVELTATPATGWSFIRWEGDLSGSDNPTQITVSGSKSVKAVFTKNKYAYNLKIVGPGVVDEFLVEGTKASFDYGTRILLKAIPDEGAVFKGWGGDITGSESDLVFDINATKNIIAEFILDDDYYKRPLIDLTKPSSMTKQLYYGLNFSSMSYFPTGFIAVDYNQDGFVDVITCHGDFDNNGRLPMVFYKGPYFTMDEANNGKYLSPLGIRKSFAGDFNGDGRPDICFVGHGNEGFPDPKDYPIFLMSREDGVFDWLGVEEAWGYHHGSAAGDFDNDGDLDVVLIGDFPELGVLLNNGDGHFSYRTDLTNSQVINGSMYTCELFDVNHDGYLDLVVGGHEHEGMYYEWWGLYKNTTCVFWGNSETFNHDNYDRFPRYKDGYGVTLDYLFYDLDDDGQEEIINVRTGDGLSQPSYRGWSIQIVSYDGTSFHDVTSTFISESENGDTEGDALIWIDMENIGGDVFLCGRFKTNAERLFLLKDCKLRRFKEERYPVISNGYSIMSDVRTMNAGWQQYAAFAFNFQNGLDLSMLVERDYCLEMYIQNTDPSLTFDYHFDVFPDDSEEELIYGAGVYCKDMKNDGSWECVRIPLKQFALWSETQQNCWNRVTQFVLITTSSGGAEFSVRDIRIRKVLPE